LGAIEFNITIGDTTLVNLGDILIFKKKIYYPHAIKRLLRWVISLMYV
jgi:hypothetical protein